MQEHTDLTQDNQQELIASIASDNQAKYGIASGIYAKTDYDLSNDYKDDVDRLYQTIQLTTDALQEGKSTEDRFELVKIGVMSKLGFRRWMLDKLGEAFEGNGEIQIDTDNLLESLNATKHNADLFINCLHDENKLGTCGKALLIQNVSNLHERLELIINRIDRFQKGEGVDEILDN